MTVSLELVTCLISESLRAKQPPCQHCWNESAASLCSIFPCLSVCTQRIESDDSSYVLELFKFFMYVYMFFVFPSVRPSVRPFDLTMFQWHGSNTNISQAHQILVPFRSQYLTIHTTAQCSHVRRNNTHSHSYWRSLYFLMEKYL
jgi:hypothetical protein